MFQFLDFDYLEPLGDNIFYIEELNIRVLLNDDNNSVLRAWRPHKNKYIEIAVQYAINEMIKNGIAIT